MVVDLFAGAGGLSLGFEMAGFDVVAAVEYDPVHAATHAYNFPNAPVICRDVRRVEALDLLAAAQEGWKAHNPEGEWDGVIDVVVGGPSCQGFSSMGKQDVDDDRNELVSEFVRLVEGLSPRAFVMENVPGILAPQFASLVDDAIRRFVAAGYTLRDHSQPLDATEYGVPQRRKRVFIVGVAPGYELVPIAKTGSEVVTVADALIGLPSLSGRTRSDGELLEMNREQSARYSESLTTPYLQTLTDMAPARLGETDGVLSGYLVTAHSAESARRFALVPQGGTDQVSRLWRLDEHRPSRTLRAGTGSERGSFSAARPLHPSEPRVITVREAARLHSFPDWFRFHGTNWHAHRQIGNAVPPLLAKAVAESVRSSLGEQFVLRTCTEMNAERDERLLVMTSSEAKLYFEAGDDDIPAKRNRVRHATAPLLATPMVDPVDAGIVLNRTPISTSLGMAVSAQL
ncbi:DNA cytosine methyltransferase [Plantibacter sp. PA-3-X8]|uniref:DNA cytosine methyltransferase n=1 Tax=Plantibacter sp. PA-3-X8 TaxID=2480625 RepID=UPI0013DE1230|nr:DNA cytosine methyltransferase [Plantibacter sp. PA-3-X8]